MTRKGKIDPQRRATFKEIAREIVREDRAAKKYGYSQNTIGAIERALKNAFLEGKAVGEGSLPDTLATSVTWEQVPPRARTTLMSMTYGLSSLGGRQTYPPVALLRFVRNGKPRWTTETRAGSMDDHSVADGSARPLIGLGLIAEDPQKPDRYTLTEAGLALCKDFWHRYDANDPTLPKLSMRPT